jgi:hypothetical protein
VSERGTELMTRVSQQFDEIAEFFGTLNDADLRKPCPDEGGDGAGETVGPAAAHLAEGYHRLGRFLQSAGYVPESPATETSHGHGHGHGHGHQRAQAPEAVPDVLDVPGLLDWLIGGKAAIGLLADLTDEQLDNVPARVNRYADGRRTLAQVIDEIFAHQAAHLAALKRAVA